MASSSSSICRWKYDVFLSFRGEDTRYTLADFLSYALDRWSIFYFKDDEKLQGGETIKTQLLRAIENSRFAVVILSDNYASSTWCLDELVEIIYREKEKRMTVLPIFYHVNPSDVRKQTGTFAEAFDEHEKQCKEKVGTWRAALKRVGNIAGYHVDNGPLSAAVKWIVRLVSIPEFSEITEGLVGMQSRLAKLHSCLALWLEDDVRCIGFWAMGGMGKSTLAKVAYKMFSNEFDACCFMEDVGKRDLFSLRKDLISQISNATNLNVHNNLEGEDMIKKLLRDNKVLLVLDDVDESNKLTKFVKSDWFGSGSRIIITTRDRHLLIEFPVDEIFEVEGLTDEDALCLFWSKAFKKEQCTGEYFFLSQRFVEYVNGLPLGLEVLGSFLFKKDIAKWESTLKMLKEDPEPKITQVLKTNFDGLPDSVKEIFLDIACFFNHEVKDHVVQILEILGRNHEIGLSILIDKSLLKISNNYLWMHDLLRDMGRDIVRQESRSEPGKRSRLWLYEDIDHVLKNNTGTKKVQAMDIWGAEACWRGFTFSKKPIRPLWNPNAFSKMSNLKFLRVRNVFPQHVPKYLPCSLRYFDWCGYPAKSLACFQPNEPIKFVQLHLQHSKIEFLWEGMKKFVNLKSINMAGSSNLIKAPNFSGVPKLEELVLEGCSKLRTLDPSIGKSKSLKLLNLKKCQELSTLPNKFELESLVTLNLTGCSKVKKIPEFVGNMKHLKEILLGGTAITELPSSVKCLTGLTSLDLTECKKFMFLPDNICSLKSLEEIILSWCPKFYKLPEYLGKITSLKKLHLCGSAIKELPSSIECMVSLNSLDLTFCKNFVHLPSTICRLKLLEEIDFFGCSKFDNLPEDLGSIVSLKILSLSHTAIEELPSSVGFLTGLQRLSLEGCKKLVLLPSTFCSLKSLESLELAGCEKFVKLPENIGNLKQLTWLCLNGTAIEVLPSSIGSLAALWGLDLFNCKNLVGLPSTIGNLEVVFSPGGYRLPVPARD